MIAAAWGVHARTDDPLAEAAALGANQVQIMLGDPQSWRAPRLDWDGGPAAFREAAAAAGLTVWVHAAYLINVASTNNRVRLPSRQLLQRTVDLAAGLGAAGVVVHGGHVTADDPPELGQANWRKCLDGLDLALPLLIENTAGGRNAMARTLDRLTALWLALADSPNRDRLGFCLDTCHAHAAGFDLGQAVDQIRAVTGRIDLVHANDSRDRPGSGADRHANLGQGQCDPVGLAQALARADAPIVLETPGGLEEHRQDRDWLERNLT
ncbi:MAG: deoxyribonuclease IV [Propionibacteriaceae bacterium]|jgi:deoxyribonuclease-4|nr:deoxyribonuclease IV [Propionibacteriaceae bacterium]